jgi:hypothetical protein
MPDSESCCMLGAHERSVTRLSRYVMRAYRQTRSAALADTDGKKKKKKKKSFAVDEEQAPAVEPATAAAAEELAGDAAKSSKKKKKKLDGLASPETVEVPVATMVLAGEGTEKKKKKKKKSLVEA